MHKNNFCWIFFISAFFSFCSIFSEKTNPDILFSKAQNLEKSAFYTEATQNYLEARKQYLDLKRNDNANECRFHIHEIQKIVLSYPYLEQAVKKIITENFPDVDEKTQDDWLKEGKIESMLIDGENHYFADFITNLRYRDIELMKKSKDQLASLLDFCNAYKNIIIKNPGAGYGILPSAPCINPVSYLGIGELNLERKSLPEKGILRLWFPLPILTAAQNNVKIISLTPQEYVKFPYQIDGDLGLAYMEIDLEKLKEDLKAELKFIFTHYEQAFTINKNDIGKYDIESSLFKTYTQSEEDITITPDISATALKIVGKEQNPYLRALKIYEYIVKNIKYSLMPHLALSALHISESIYVHEHKYGDCGAQSIYFCALLRSLGIPAIATGGWQINPSKPGTHFWANFYLPNYGWIPVDPTAADMADYVDFPKSYKKKFQKYFFGNQDPYRFTIQKNVDIDLTPTSQQPPLIPLAIQLPSGECATMEENPNLLIADHWKMSFFPIDR